MEVTCVDLHHSETYFKSMLLSQFLSNSLENFTDEIPITFSIIETPQHRAIIDTLAALHTSILTFHLLVQITDDYYLKIVLLYHEHVYKSCVLYPEHVKLLSAYNLLVFSCHFPLVRFS